MHRQILLLELLQEQRNRFVSLVFPEENLNYLLEVSPLTHANISQVCAVVHKGVEFEGEMDGTLFLEKTVHVSEQLVTAEERQVHDELMKVTQPHYEPKTCRL